MAAGQRSTPRMLFDVTAEEAVLAALLLDEDAIQGVYTLLEPEDFYRDQHKWFYEAACALFDRGERITLPTVAHELDVMGRLDQAGGEPWLVELAGKYFTALGVEAHARIVARESIYRQLLSAAQQIARLAYAGGPDAAGTLSASEDMLRRISSRCHGSTGGCSIPGLRSAFA